MQFELKIPRTPAIKMKNNNLSPASGPLFPVPNISPDGSLNRYCIGALEGVRKPGTNDLLAVEKATNY